MHGQCHTFVKPLNVNAKKIILVAKFMGLTVGKGVHDVSRFIHLQKEAPALEQVELDACRKQLELEKNRNQTLQQKLGNPVCPPVFLSQTRPMVPKSI